MKKTLTNAAVGNATMLLLAASPSEQITTLEVKTLLRNLGFYATQDDVSDKLAEVAENIGLNHTTVTEEGNTFRVYAVKELVEVEEEEADPTAFQFRTPTSVKVAA